jgi:hypothetical protein
MSRTSGEIVEGLWRAPVKSGVCKRRICSPGTRTKFAYLSDPSGKGALSTSARIVSTRAIAHQRNQSRSAVYRMRLTHEQVHLIRTAGKTDRHRERLWRISAQSIRNARVGITWADHPTPPDTKPRAHRGNWGDLA